MRFITVAFLLVAMAVMVFAEDEVKKDEMITEKVDAVKEVEDAQEVSFTGDDAFDTEKGEMSENGSSFD